MTSNACNIEFAIVNNDTLVNNNFVDIFKMVDSVETMIENSFLTFAYKNHKML